MQGLDAHNSALWVANERRLDEQSRTQKYLVRVAVEGYVDVEVNATSEDDANDQAKASLDLVMGNRYKLALDVGKTDMIVVGQFIVDTEVVK